MRCELVWMFVVWRGRQKELGNAKAREFIYSLAYGWPDNQIHASYQKFTHFRYDQDLSQWRSCRPCSQPCFDLQRQWNAYWRQERDMWGGWWVRSPGLYRNQGIGRSRQEKMGAHGPNDRTSHTIGRGDVWLVTSDVVWSNERSNCYISHKFKSA